MESDGPIDRFGKFAAEAIAEMAGLEDEDLIEIEAAFAAAFAQSPRLRAIHARILERLAAGPPPPAGTPIH